MKKVFTLIALNKVFVKSIPHYIFTLYKVFTLIALNKVFVKSIPHYILPFKWYYRPIIIYIHLNYLLICQWC